MQLWDWEENSKEGLFPEKLSVSSRQVANWICNQGHKYRATVFSKYYGYGCPYCANIRVLTGFNDFGSKHKDLLDEWDFEKNSDDPFQITEKNGKKYWWHCKNGHSWQSRTADKINGHGCPYCSGRAVLKSINDLQTTNPSLASEWNFEKNGSLKPNDIKAGSKRVVWWKCKNGHEWKATIKNRSMNGSGCPYCSGTKVILGVNDLATRFPSLCAEWNYDKNGDTKPANTSCYSNKKVWWLGKCGHVWQDTPGHRVQGRGCPVCNKQNRTSFPEQAIFYYLKEQYPDAKNSYTDIFPGSMELDIYVPSERIGIEYDGKAWHNTEKAYERELKKYELCKKNGIKLIRIKESINENDNQTSDILMKTAPDLQDTLTLLTRYLKMGDINVERDRQAILENYLERRSKNTLQEVFPEVAKQWNYHKNGSLRPNMFFPYSAEKVWWVCDKGHEWEASIRDRATDHSGCPYCSNHRLLQGFNDLLTVAPLIAAEWDTEKNGELTPETVKAYSNIRANWICSNGHRWQAKIRERVIRNSGCPECYRNRRRGPNSR